MSQYPDLLKSLKLKTVTIRNRVMSTAHTSGAGEDGKPKLKYQLYHEEKAKGGIGLTIVGGSTSIAEDSPGADMLHLDASSDDIVPFYQKLSSRIRRHGATVFAQLAHMGRRANWNNENWLSPVSPSPVREPAHRSFPKEMEDWDFRRLREAFGRAAARVKAGGMQGLELSATHGHLIDQFWQPQVNRRTDRYGGSLENRLRFTFEILEEVRKAVGDDFVVGLRMAADELMDGGLRSEDCIEIARQLVEKGGVDYLSVLASQAENLPAHALIFPNMSMKSAPYLHFASALKAAVSVPVFHAQKMSDLAVANRAIRDGHIDMVAMTRAHMADPHVVTKLLDGREEDIRPCVGANYCIDRLYAGGQALCLHNAATGRELSMPHVVRRGLARRRAVVIGAGPAGLEAARVLGSRGHRVTVFEKERETGGAVRIAARAPWRGNLLAITRWLELQARKASAEIVFGAEAGRETVAALEPDVVIVATGGVAAVSAIDGASHVALAGDVLERDAALSGDVLIFDDNGSESALSCAEALLNRAERIEFVTADPAPGMLLERTTLPTFLRHLYEGGVVFTPNTRLTRVYVEGNKRIAVLRNEHTGALEEREVDHVVLEYGRRPSEALYLDLKPFSRNLGEVDYAAQKRGDPQVVDVNPSGAFQLFRIGDAVSSRNIHAAIYDALRLCKDL